MFSVVVSPVLSECMEKTCRSVRRLDLCLIIVIGYMVVFIVGICVGYCWDNLHCIAIYFGLQRSLACPSIAMKLPACTCKPVKRKRRKQLFPALIVLLLAYVTPLQIFVNRFLISGMSSTLCTAQEQQQRFKCQPIGLCEPCAPSISSSNPACLPYGNRQPLLCTATRDLPAHLEAPDLPLPSHHTPITNEEQASIEAQEREKAILDLKGDSIPARKRDLFWESDGVPHRDALQKLREISWEGVRIKEAQAQAVSLEGQTFTSWSACGKVVSKEVNDFGEFVVSSSCLCCR